MIFSLSQHDDIIVSLRIICSKLNNYDSVFHKLVSHALFLQGIFNQALIKPF